MNPYQTLGIPADSNEQTVRQRYLQLVRENPPDRQPQKFAEIHAAYEQLRDPVTRLESMILQSSSNDSPDQIIADVRANLRGERIPVNTLLSLVGN